MWWSVDVDAQQVWSPLIAARKALGEWAGAGTEPDLIHANQSAVTIIEVKFTSGSVTPKALLPPYHASEPRWSRVFRATPDVVLERIGYELLRFCLLGEALSAETGLPWRLMSLTRATQDASLAKALQGVLFDPDRYAHVTWTDIARVAERSSDHNKRILTRYLKTKSAGYRPDGHLATLVESTRNDV